MAKLILEITTRGDQRYIPIDRPLLRVGRALDNDVILSDPTVSPHHFLIKRDAAGDYWLHSLSEENGTYVGRKAVTSPVALTDDALSFEAGRTRLRVLHDDATVAPTRLLSCRTGRTCLFDSWAWAWALFALFIGISLVDNYLSTPRTLDWESFGRDQTVIVSVVLAISAGVAVLVRLIAHRWEPAGAVSFVCLMLLIATLLDQLASFGDYFFSTSAVGFSFDMAWSFLIGPVALYWFLVRINHANALSGIIITLALMTPAAYFQSRQLINHYGLFDTFSKKAHYPTELHFLEIRRGPTLSIREFVSEMSDIQQDN
jgi:hypothetical protein